MLDIHVSVMPRFSLAIVAVITSIECALALAAPTEKLAPVRRVDARSTASDPDGLTWETAFRTVEDAAAAWTGEVWVAEGTYEGSIVMSPGESFYGGFAGNELHRGQRDWRAHSTVVDGGNQNICFTGADHVTLDGFTIRNGRPAMFNNSSCCVRVDNCTFSANQAFAGGAIYNLFSSLTVTNSIFSENSAKNTNTPIPGTPARDFPGAGGAIYNSLCSFVGISDCIFSHNTADFMGGALGTLDTSEGTISNCVFSFNTAPRGGAVAGSSSLYADFVNCTFASNIGDKGAAVYVETFCSPSLVNCVLRNVGATELFGTGYDVVYSCVRGGYAGEGNITADPKFVDAENGDLRLQPDSPCIDAGVAWDAPARDILSVSRPQGARLDMGAYEYVSAVEGEGEGEGEQVSAPDVSGMSASNAQAALINAGVALGTITEEYSGTVPPAYVISQSPTAGSSVAPGTPINIVLSKGPQPVSVPDLNGKTQSEAQTALESIGLALGNVIEDFSASVPVGQVISQTPVAGSSVAPGTLVNIIISKGPESEEGEGEGEGENCGCFGAFIGSAGPHGPEDGTMLGIAAAALAVLSATSYSKPAIRSRR